MLCNTAKCATVQVIVLACLATGAAALHFTGATEQRALIDAFLTSSKKPADAGPAAGAPSANGGSTEQAPGAGDPSTEQTSSGGDEPATNDGGGEKPFSLDDLDTMITVEQAVKLYNLPYEDPDAPQVIFLDARERDHYERSHVPMAYHVTPQSFFDGTLPEDLDYWAKDSIIVVYCSGGDCDASHLVEARLRQQKSFTRVYILQPGFPGWQELGLPTESGPPSN